MPIDFKSIVPNGSRVSSSWGSRKAPTTGASKDHLGSDIAAPLGSSVVNQAEGKVVFVGNATGFGPNTVIVEHQLPDGLCVYSMKAENVKLHKSNLKRLILLTWTRLLLTVCTLSFANDDATEIQHLCKEGEEVVFSCMTGKKIFHFVHTSLFRS